jgi:hypothetical protein
LVVDPESEEMKTKVLMCREGRERRVLAVRRGPIVFVWRWWEKDWKELWRWVRHRTGHVIMEIPIEENGNGTNSSEILFGYSKTPAFNTTVSITPPSKTPPLSLNFPTSCAKSLMLVS